MLPFTLLIVSCSDGSQNSTQDAIPIVARDLAFLPEENEVEAVGTARAITSAQIFPETAGQVRRVLFSAGDYVRKGQPLVELDSRREKLAVELAKVRVQEADQLLTRYRRIEDTGALSASQIEAGETALASANVELQQAQTNLADRTIRAPFSGHIGLTDIDPGDRITNTTAIAQLDQRSTLYIDFAAPEAIFAELQPGETVSVTPFSEPDRTISAQVIATDSAISQSQRTFTVRTRIANTDDSLRPGMSFRVLFRTTGSKRPAVPEQAIIWGGEGSFIWAVREGKAHRIPVSITSRRDGLAFLDAPLDEEEVIVVEGVQKLREGQEVRILKPSAPSRQDAVLRETDGNAAGSDGD
ncbi:efflux RND transporter periplasmic adaptor subunit [Altericroceibacterium spongiae]|uniref:efflux RND transporter periplasmic adaptor subunit n=1 Tax=Altericroceibacterium spongiae TaxID=2320269 RepID=UPI001EE56A24|nr:efflux RND transporter periplasmic adaptor subunit [Altericroceibacterium spongiae]